MSSLRDSRCSQSIRTLLCVRLCASPHALQASLCDCLCFRRSGGGGGFLLHEAFAAEDGATLSGAEGDGGLLAALDAGSARFDARVVVSIARRRRGGEDGHALGLAGFAAFGLVLELFVVEK